MKRIKILLAGLLCAALAMPVNDIEAATTINRHSASKSEGNSDMEESSHLDTTITETEKDVIEQTSHTEKRIL